MLTKEEYDAMNEGCYIQNPARLVDITNCKNGGATNPLASPVMNLAKDSNVWVVAIMPTHVMAFVQPEGFPSRLKIVLPRTYIEENFVLRKTQKS